MPAKKLPARIYPLGAEGEEKKEDIGDSLHQPRPGGAANRFVDWLRGGETARVATGRNVLGEEALSRGALEFIRSKVGKAWHAVLAWRLPPQEALGKLIWHHRYFHRLAVVLHLLNLTYILWGIYLLLLYLKTWADACEPEVFPIYWWHMRESEWVKYYASINAWKVLVLIIITKVATSYGLLFTLRCFTCPLRLRLTWSEAMRTTILVDWFNPFLFTCLLAWYIRVGRSEECRAHYYSSTSPSPFTDIGGGVTIMYARLKQMVDVQLLYQLPFVAYLYGGAVLCCVKNRTVNTVEWLLDGCPDYDVKREDTVMYIVEAGDNQA